MVWKHVEFLLITHKYDYMIPGTIDFVLNATSVFYFENRSRKCICLVRKTCRQLCEAQWLSAVWECTHPGLYICTYHPLLHFSFWPLQLLGGPVSLELFSDRVFSVKVVEEEEEARDTGATWPQQRDSQTNINYTRSWGSEYLLGLLVHMEPCVCSKGVKHSGGRGDGILGSAQLNPATLHASTNVCAPFCVRVCALFFFFLGMTALEIRLSR